MTEFKGSETEKNLLKAFAEEAVEAYKYSLFAALAKAEGLDFIHNQFEEIASNEKEHAKIWFRWLNEGTYPKTIDNIKEAVKLEEEAGASFYPEYAETARKEGFEHLAGLFELVAGIEKEHIGKFKKIYEALQNENIEPDEHGNFIWQCSACGAVIIQKDRPDFCPLCKHDETFFFKQNPVNL